MATDPGDDLDALVSEAGAVREIFESMPLMLAGASGMAATLLYFYATHFTMLATAAVLVSLYPAITVLLARIILRERFTPAQRAGLGLCTLAIIAVTLN